MNFLLFGSALYYISRKFRPKTTLFERISFSYRIFTNFISDNKYTPRLSATPPNLGGEFLLLTQLQTQLLP